MGSPCRPEQQAALAALYGPAAPGGDACGWQEVACDDEGDVIAVDLGRLPQASSHLEAVEGLPQLAVLFLPRNARGDLRHVARLTDLTVLDLNRAENISGDLSSLSGLRYLIRLVLPYTSVRGDLESLAGLTHLQVLDLTQTQVAGSLESLRGMTALHVLYGNGTAGISGDIEALAGMENMTGLALGSTNVWGSLHSVNKMSGLRELYLYGAAGVGGDIRGLRDNVQLREIDVRDTAIYGDVQELASLTELTKIDLAATAVSGTIPNTWRKMRILALYKSNVGGPLPESLAEWKDLTIFSSHLTSLSGRLPMLPESLLSLSLYGARLSCDFPQASDAWSSGLSARPQLLLAGNAFSSFPPWLQDSERQSFLLVETHNDVLYTLAIAPLVFALILAWHLHSFPRVKQVLADLFKPSEHYVVSAHLWALKLLVGNACIGLILLLCYYLGANFFECGDVLSKFSVSYFAEVPNTEQAVGVLWCVQLVYSAVMIASAPANIGPITFLDASQYRCWTYKNMLAATLWMFIVVVLCFPSVAYVAVGCLPHDSRIQLGRTFKQVVRSFCSLWLVAMSSFVFPGMVVKVPCFARLHSSKMLLFASTLVVWLVAAATVAWLDQDCAQGWVSFDARCAHPSNFEPLVGVNCSTMPRPWSCVVTQAEYCGGRMAFRPGRCVRSIVSKLTPLMLEKMLLSAFVMPMGALLMLRWFPNGLQLRFGPSRLLRLDPIDRLSNYRQAAQLVTWLEVVLVFGPLAPALYLPVIAAVCTNLLVFRMAADTHSLELPEDGSQLSRTYMFASILLMSAFCGCFAAFEMSHDHGAILTTLAVPAALLASCMVAYRRWRHSSRSNTIRRLLEVSIYCACLCTRSCCTAVSVGPADVDNIR